MSMSSSLFRQKNHAFSADIQDLRQQNRVLYQENLTLKRSLQELMTINNELTESIEEFNNSHMENFPQVNQQEIQQLALKVVELEQELEREKIDRAQEREEMGAASQQNNTIEETLKVIEELVKSVNDMQEEYQRELERMEVELENQRNQWLQMSEAVEDKMVRFEKQYNKLVEELRESENIIKSLEGQLQEKNRNASMSRKQLKISTTIQDLRVTLEKQIEEKDRVIKMYERTLQQVKSRLTEKIST